jgi:hypothetical protein
MHAVQPGHSFTIHFVKMSLTDSAKNTNNIQNCGKNANSRFTAGKKQNT